MVLLIVWCFYLFLFKQKTAYEMRISDWSSDVCSSDLSPISNAWVPACGPLAKSSSADGARAERVTFATIRHPSRICPLAQADAAKVVKRRFKSPLPRSGSGAAWILLCSIRAPIYAIIGPLLTSRQENSPSWGGALRGKNF